MINPVPWIGVLVVIVTQKLWPQSFEFLFLLNIWAVSLPHTFSTFTRSDRKTVKHLSFTLLLGILFAVLVTFTAASQGMVLVYSFYFLWQQFHYCKQNFGLARKAHPEGPRWFDLTYYIGSTAVILLALVSEGPQNFFGYALVNPLPVSLSKISALVLVCALLVPILVRRKGIVPALEHAAIFSFAYLFTEHFALGWLCLNVFHNLQYLSFMKLVEKKFSFLVLPAGLTLILFVLQKEAFGAWVIPSMLALNFTHYTLDGLIWKNVRGAA